MSDIRQLGNIFSPSDEDRAMIDAVREAMIDPSPRKIGRLEQWGQADEYETYAEVAEYSEIPIIMGDGTRIDAALSTPRNLPQGQKCPVVIMPAPLSPLGRTSYLGMFPRWALGGYICLAYSQRGLAGSTGEIQVAGPLDRSDGRQIIDWLTGREGVDPDRIGCFGASYGAGTSFLLAAHDERVKAVAGSSAWTDLFLSLFENGTRHIQAFNALVELFHEDRCSEEFRRIIEKVRNNPEPDDEVREFAQDRSPMSYLKTYNDRQLPMLMTTYWHETIFSLPGVVSFFRELTSPKSLLIQVGDHGTGELPGLLGLPAKPTAMTYRWMDHYLGGHSGIGPEPLFGVRSEYMHNVASELHHDSWHDYALTATQFCLTGTAENTRDGRLIPDTPQTDWATPLRAGVPTEAIVAPELVNTGGQERLGRPHIYPTAEIDREHAWVWNSAPLERPMRVQGDLHMRITVKPQAETATIIAYLFDYNPATRKAAIITSAPYTFRNGGPEETRTVEFSLQPAHYVLQQGHQLQLVIDSKDRFFADATVDNTTLQASSPANAHSYISIPLHQLP